MAMALHFPRPSPLVISDVLNPSSRSRAHRVAGSVARNCHNRPIWVKFILRGMTMYKIIIRMNTVLKLLRSFTELYFNASATIPSYQLSAIFSISLMCGRMPLKILIISCLINFVVLNFAV